jgi:hypothetical protein
MKLILQLLLILVIIATFSICAIKPDLHKNVIVYDSDYTLVSEQDVTTETKNIPVMEMSSQPVQKITVAETKIEPTVKNSNTKTSNVKQQTQTKPKQIATVKQTVTKPQVHTVQKPIITTVQKPVAKEVVKVTPQKVEQKITSNPLPQTSSIKSERDITTPKVLIQQEETIAWNKWRSNLTNQIMQDTKLPNIPNGVLFQFSFTVDKYGKITNVQTGANPANYTPYAIQYIAPVIRSYQGRSILNFPSGTSRVSTQVTGKWRISNTQKYSTPQDYNDIEKVIRNP